MIFDDFVFNQHKPMEIHPKIGYGFFPWFSGGPLLSELQFPGAVILALEIVGQPGFGAQG